MGICERIAHVGDHSYKVYSAICDLCNNDLGHNELVGEIYDVHVYDDPDEVVHLKKRAGWVRRKNGEVWEDICYMCHSNGR